MKRNHKRNDANFELNLNRENIRELEKAHSGKQTREIWTEKCEKSDLHKYVSKYLATIAENIIDWWF